MSHKATTWLADVDAQRIGASEFRVLFHLCDCHNPAAGCFPTQAYLLEACGVSNGTLNNALNALEAKGLIQRHKAWDGRTKRQKPTRYILGFEMDGAQEPSPKSGDGKRRKPSPKSGDGADSNLRGDPSPISGVTRLQPTGEVTCKEPVNNPRTPCARRFFTDQERMTAREIADHIRQGGTLIPGRIPTRIRTCLIVEKMISEADAKKHGLAAEEA